MAHFLRMRRLETDAGVNFRVQRTQMENLPPLDTPTYRDIMRDSYKHVQQIEKEYDRLANLEITTKAVDFFCISANCTFIVYTFTNIFKRDISFYIYILSFSFAKKEKKHKAAFIKKLKEDQQEHKKREAALLNKPHEVKRLSDLLMLEMTVSQSHIY